MDEFEAFKEFLLECELQQYYDLFRDILKITKISQLKFVVIEDLAQIGLSKPEQRRYKKIYSKYFPNNYVAKIKKLLGTKKQEAVNLANMGFNSDNQYPEFSESNVKTSPKHIIAIEDISMNKELGMGQFGVVQQGTWATGNQRIQVAIKCLGNERMTSNSTEFLKEAAVMHSIDHPNIVRLYGVVLHLDSLMLVTELAPLRSLLECLREVTFRTNFPVLNLCEFAEQICDGMTYLENKRLIHRDLAARNILVFSKDRVKISDFGLSRALGVGKDYYQTNYNVNLKLPVAWCAPECILYLRFTTSSDIWAFGVCMWEMFTYGFQPWAAFSGQQILEAIDSPNYQRLERPECCPEEYYALMLQCWAHDPNDRPTFKDVKIRLMAIKPPEVEATCTYVKPEDGRRSSFLEYKTGQKITVLAKEDYTHSAMWYGVLPGGTCGLFDPNNTKPCVKVENARSFASGSYTTRESRSANRSFRSTLLRSDAKRHTYTGKRSLQHCMISGPQGDVKHTGHVGLDGAFFGDIAFLDVAGCPPRQIVAPYKPSDDLEQVPLINPNSPSHLVGTTCIAYPLLTSHNVPSGCSGSGSGGDKRDNRDSKDSKDSKPGKASKKSSKSKKEESSGKSLLSKVKSATLGRSHKQTEDTAAKSSEAHEYHEISDTDTESTATDNARAEVAAPDSPGIPKTYTDFSQSLLNEIEVMFRNHGQRKEDGQFQQEEVATAIRNALGRTRTLSKSEKNKIYSTMKPMSPQDERTLETACAMANELTAKSMNDLGEDKQPTSPSEKSKFHFKFPLVSLHHSNHHEADKEPTAKRNFSEEANSVPDIQASITEESKMVYASLIEEPTPALSVISRSHDMLAKPSTIPKESPKNQYTQSHFNSLQKPVSGGLALGDPSASITTIDSDGNELPLPPRSTKPKLVDKPRHYRKYPLRLPGRDIPGPILNTPANVQACAIYQNTRALMRNEEREAREKAHREAKEKAQAEAKALAEEKAQAEAKAKAEQVIAKADAEVQVEEKALAEAMALPETRARSRAAAKPAEEENASALDPRNPFELPTSTYPEIELPDLSTNPFNCYISNLDASLEEGEDQIFEEVYLKGEDRDYKRDHVSVEDLLQFADKKPSSKQRGVESDEVRIMNKVLKQQASPEECLEALEFTDWNVHIAIKLLKIKTVVAGDTEVTFDECLRELERFDGDVAKASSAIVFNKKEDDG
ncbi:unnamed protein product [Colias eurytheme]|nr:unnamed protein product [Colias eurytheme]